jgi:outer membrane protein assembly factor BamB
MTVSMRRILALCFVFSLSACATLAPIGDAIGGLFSNSDNSEPPAELTDYQAELKFEIIWDESDGVGVDEQVINLVPAVADDKIIIADHEGLVLARRLTDGETLWEVETDLPISVGPVVSGDLLYIATSKAHVLALNVATGEAVWKQRVSSEVLALPVIAGEILLLRTTDGKEIALNKVDGKEIWSIAEATPALSIRGDGSPVVDGETVIIGSANGKLTALNLNDGAHLWETSIATPRGRSEIERLTDINGSPLLVSSAAYISTYKSGLASVSTVDGDILWRNEKISSEHGLAADDYYYLYVTDSVSDLWKLDQDNGRSYWKQSALHRRQLSMPAVYDDYVVVGDYEGYLHWLSKTDGRLLGRVEITDKPIMARPIIVDNMVYVYASDGTLAAVKVLLY